MNVLVLVQYFPSSMSASVELLRAIDKSGLKVCEVPVSCKYAPPYWRKNFNQKPYVSRAGLIVSLIKLVVEDRPLPTLEYLGNCCL